MVASARDDDEDIEALESGYWHPTESEAYHPPAFGMAVTTAVLVFAVLSLIYAVLVGSPK